MTAVTNTPAPSPVEERVEQVARALCETERHEWEHISGSFADYFRRQARAAIAAMPASPAEEAVRRVVSDWLTTPADDPGSAAYTAMCRIRAVLAAQADR